MGSCRASRRFSALVVLLAMASTGCQLRMTVDVDVNRDGGGVLSVALTADEQLQARAGAADADPLGDLVETGATLGQGWSVRETEGEDGDRTVMLTSAFADPEEFSALAADLAEALAADEADLLEPLQVTVTEEDITVEGAAALRPTSAVRDYGLTPDKAVRLLRRSEAFEYQVVVTLPGEVLSAEGADTSGDDAQTVAWTVKPGKRVRIAATGARPGPPWARGLLGALGGGLVAGVVLWLLARRRRGGTAPPPT